MKLRKKKGFVPRKYAMGGEVHQNLPLNVRDLLDALSYDIRPSTLPDMSGDPDLDRRLPPISHQEAVAESTAGPRILPPIHPRGPALTANIIRQAEELQRQEDDARPLSDALSHISEIKPAPDRNYLHDALYFLANPITGMRNTGVGSDMHFPSKQEMQFDQHQRGFDPLEFMVGFNPVSWRAGLSEHVLSEPSGEITLPLMALLMKNRASLLGGATKVAETNALGQPIRHEYRPPQSRLLPNERFQNFLDKYGRKKPSDPARIETELPAAEAAVNETFLSEGMGEATIPRGPGASGSTSIPKRQPSDIYGELGQQRQETSWRLLRNQPNLTARQVNSDADVDQVFYGEDGKLLEGDAFEQARAKYQAAQRYQMNVQNAHKDQYQYEGNVRQLPSLMHGSKLEHSVGNDGTIQVNQVQALINKGQLSVPEAQNLQAALDQSVQDASEAGLGTDRVDYSVLKRNAEVLADPFDLVRRPTTVEDQYGSTQLKHDAYQAYGVDNLFLPDPGMIGRGETHKTIDYGPDLDEILETTETNLITTDVPELRNSVKGHFGKEVTGHYRTFRMPGEPDVLYISEMQADPLQARKEEYTLPSGEEIKTRQLSLTGGRRYDDKFRAFQQETAVSLHKGLGDLNNSISNARATLLDARPSTVASEKRMDQVEKLTALWREIKHKSGNNYDHMMQKQMEEQGGIQGFHEIVGYSRPRSYTLFGKPENKELEAIGDRLISLRAQLNDIHSYYTAAENKGYPVEPEVQATIESQNEFIAEEIDALQETIQHLQENVMLFNETLEAGYNGQLTPLQAKMVKDQDKFLVGKILQAEAAGASVIRFPRGETVRKIQGYGTMEDVVAETEEQISSTYSDIEDHMEFFNNTNPLVFSYAPEGQSNRLMEMAPEEYVQWYKNYENEKSIGDARGKRETAKIEEMTRTIVDERLASLKSEALDDGVIYLDPSGQVGVTDPEALIRMFHKRELLAQSANREAAVKAIQGDPRAVENVYLMQLDMTNYYLHNLSSNYEQIMQAQEHLNIVQNQGGDEELLAQQAIMDGYERMTKAFDKHNLTYREVMDEYGNGWYEVDVPANFNAKAGEVRAYRIGGRVPMKIKKKKAFNLVKQ